jgi:hypothetical protein
MRPLILIVAMAAVLTGGLSPAHAVSCEEVRALSKAEQAY